MRGAWAANAPCKPRLNKRLFPSHCFPLLPVAQNTWTGTATRGGPTNVDGNKDLSSLCDRTAADARGVSKTSNFSRQH